MDSDIGSPDDIEALKATNQAEPFFAFAALPYGLNSVSARQADRAGEKRACGRCFIGVYPSESKR